MSRQLLQDVAYGSALSPILSTQLRPADSESVP
jgi:hypothetical protein